MSWIFDNLQILVLVLFAVGSLVKKINESRTTAKQPPRPADLPEPMFETDEESSTFDWPEEAPTPPPLPGAMIEAQREAAQVLKHQLDLAAHLQQLRETKASTTGGAAATRERVASKGAAKRVTAQAPLSLRNRLKCPAEVRQAIVMHEILAPPVSLR